MSIAGPLAYAISEEHLADSISMSLPLMSSLRPLVATVFCGALFFSTTLHAVEASLTADPVTQTTVELSDGSRLVGAIVDIRDDKLYLATQFDEEDLEIGLEYVVNLEWRHPTEILLKNDQLVNLEGLVVSGGEVVSQQASLGLTDIAIMNPRAWEKGEGYRWTGDTSAALVVNRGNTETDELDVAINTVVRSTRDRYTINARLDKDSSANADYDASSPEGPQNRKWIDTTDNWKLLGKYDYFLTDSSYYVGANVAVEADTFAEIDLRTYIGPYIGKKLIEKPYLALDGELGAAYVQTDYLIPASCFQRTPVQKINCDEPSESYGAVNWNLTGESTILGGDSKLYLRHIGILGVSGSDQLLLKTTAGLSFPLVFGFQAAAEITVDYDASLDTEVDEKYNFRIGYAW